MASKQISDLLPASSLNDTDLMVAQQIEGCAKFSLDALANYILSQSDRGFISASIATNTTVSSPMHGKDYLYYAAPSASDITLALPYTGPNIPATGTRVWVLNASTTHRVTVSFGASDSETILPGFSLALFWAGSEWTPLWTNLQFEARSISSGGTLAAMPGYVNLIEFTGSSPATYVLPYSGAGTPPPAGASAYIVNAGSATLTVTISGSSSTILAAGQVAQLLWTGSVWRVIYADSRWEGRIAAIETGLVSVAGLFQPGRTIQTQVGRRRAVSSTNPWHPIAVSRVFAQADAPDFFDALYNEYIEGDSSLDSLTEYGRPISAMASGVQALGDLPAWAIEMIHETGRMRAYDIATNNAPAGIGGAKSASSPWLSWWTINAATDLLTLYTPYTASVEMRTGIPVAVYAQEGAVDNTDLIGKVVYLRAVSATTATLHPSLIAAESNTNKINLLGTGSVVLDMWTPAADIVVGVSTPGLSVPIGNYKLTTIYNNKAFIQTASNTHAPDSSVRARLSGHRVAGSSASVIWHAIEDAAIMTPLADGSIANGTMQLDQMQGHRHKTGFADDGGSDSQGGIITVGSGNNWVGANASFAQQTLYVGNPRSDGTNGTPRTGATTRPRNVRWDSYVYVGANTL